MTALLILVVAALAIAVFQLSRRVARLERVLAGRAERLPAPAPPATPRPARAPRPSPRAPLRERLSFETLVGGRLPIWIGGAALVFAGFFLVRYTVEIGLLGPGVRTLLAGLFAALLIAGSEAARRVPAFAADPRIGQALSGAGVASAYGTLYMAAALYHLVPALPAFAVMLAITAIALALALRHGPPTAIMALVGGFAAPLVAGFDAAGIAPLLVYLGLFIAALFGLAVHRGWAWLALAACAAGFAWANFLLYILTGDDLAAVGLFVVLLAIGGSASLPASGTLPAWLRLAPLVAGLAQLVLFAPALHFDALAWALYLSLGAAALFLAWRDARYLPGVTAALALTILLIAAALIRAEHGATPYAIVVATALFAVPGHLRARDHRQWAIAAIGGTALPLLTTDAFASELLPVALWSLLLLAAAALCAFRSWSDRDRIDCADPGLIGGAAFAATLATVAIAQPAGYAWLGLPLALAMAALAWWAPRTGDTMLYRLPTIAFLAALVAGGAPLAQFARLVAGSIVGQLLPYTALPPLTDVLRSIAAPAATAIALALVDPRQFDRYRKPVLAAAITLALLALYAIAKQPLAIADPGRFRALGFLERALITQACLGSGWALLRAGKAPSLGRALMILGGLRFVWFDWLIVNPAFVAQWSGPLPILDIAFAHTALAAFWIWTLPPAPTARRLAATATIGAALALVREASHGAIMTGPIGTGENWGYSAALLGLALAWLWRGIAADKHDLRLFGLALLTAVTLKVFLIDAAALEGLLRILSFLGLGLALIGIGWAYGRFLARPNPAP